ncbi:MAG: Rrf2 family transcriptional regulator [Proteobacteria bacterium]|nr:MAG: Rrf2 family transcriptional regulator [Pseudomonadota bacterium]
MASVNTQFSIAVHLLAGIATREGLVTSEALASSVNTNPAFVKRILAKLSKAALVNAVSGKSGGCELARKPKDINLLDVYVAVEAPSTFAIHEYPSVKSCEVSSNIKGVLGNVLDSAQRSFEKDLSKTTIADVVAKIRSS